MFVHDHRGVPEGDGFEMLCRECVVEGPHLEDSMLDVVSRGSAAGL